MTHDHNRLFLGDLGEFSGGHGLGMLRSLGGQPRLSQELSDTGCFDTKAYVLWD